jgi:hypothetical protein
VGELRALRRLVGAVFLFGVAAVVVMALLAVLAR